MKKKHYNSLIQLIVAFKFVTVLVVCIQLFSQTVQSEPIYTGVEPNYWWYKFPTYSDVAVFSDVPARVVQGNFGADFAWGQYAQRLSLRSTKSQISQARNINPNVKIMSYIEGLGQPRLYTAGFITNNGVFPKYSNETDLVEMKNNAWRGLKVH